jgi:hypothetical protein
VSCDDAVPERVAPVSVRILLDPRVVLEGPGEAPNGPRMIARHGDGAVFEYIEPRQD